MPKTTNTRRQRALRLLEMLEQGPAFGGNPTFSREEAVASYQLWSQSWILPEVEDLIPELRKEKKQ